jgi:hypothetical protein
MECNEMMVSKDINVLGAANYFPDNPTNFGKAGITFN